MSGDQISRKDFVACFGTRRISMDAMENDAELRPLLRVTYTDGKLRFLDEDGDGYISAAEAEGPFDAVDHFDSNGDMHSVDPSDPRVGRLTDAMAALSERGQVAQSIRPGGRDECIELRPGHRRSPRYVAWSRARGPRSVPAPPGLLDGDFQSRREEMNAVDDRVDLYNNVHGQELGERLAAEMRLPPARGCTPELTAQYSNRVQDYFTETKGWQSEPLDPMDAHVMSFTSRLNEMQERRNR